MQNTRKHRPVSSEKVLEDRIDDLLIYLISQCS